MHASSLLCLAPPPQFQRHYWVVNMSYRAGQKLLLQKEYMEIQERQERERQERERQEREMMQRQMQQRGDQLSVPLSVHQQQQPRLGGGMDVGEVPSIQVWVGSMD